MNYQLLTFCKGLLLLLCFTLLSSNLQGQNIYDFSSIANSSRGTTFKIPATHDFQYLTYHTQFGSLDNFDFTGYIPINNSSSNGYLGINHEITAGGVTVFNIYQNQNTKQWNLSNTKAVEYGNINRPCSGAVTSWGALLSGEESSLGSVWETNPATGTSIERYQLGRLAHENVVENTANNRTFYTGEDTGNGVLLKFVANQAQNLSAGTLYALQRNGTSGTWIQIANGPSTNTNAVAIAAGATPFNGIEDVEISPIDGKVYFAVKGTGIIYRFNENNPLSGGTVSNFEVYAGDGATYNTGNGNVAFGTQIDNLAFDNAGNLWALQDGGNYHIWVIEEGHTQANPQVKIFGQAPSGSEPTGITFTPDFKYLFMSFQHPSGNNSQGQQDIFNNTVPNGRDFAVVIARNETWSTAATCTNNNSINLADYTVSEYFNTINNVNQLSGIAAHTNGNVFAIDDDATKIIQFRPDGTIVDESAITGFADTEGIVYLGNNEFGIVEEGRARVVFVTINPNSMPATINYPGSNSYITVTIDAGDNGGGTNNRLEGLAYDATTQTIYIAKQTNNKKIYSYDLGSQRSGTITPTAIDISNLTSAQFHGMHFASSGHLLVLGNFGDDNSANRILYEVDVCGDIVSSKSLNNNLNQTPNGTTVSTVRMEGVTEDIAGNLYFVVDQNPGKIFKLTKVQATCDAPTGLNATNVSNNAATMTWTASNTANSYRVEYKKVSDASWTVSIAATPSLFNSLLGLTPDTDYQWRIRSNCANGQTSAYAQGSFSTIITCNPPQGLSSTEITSTSARLNWNSAIGANTYRVEYKKSTESTWILRTGSTSALTVVTTGLDPSTTYNWRIRSNCTGLNSNYRSTTFTTTTPACDIPSNPTSTTTSNSATVSWSVAAGANTYRVEYRTSNVSTWTIATSGTSASSITISNLLSNRSYVWRVRSNCTGTNSNYTSSTFITQPGTCNAPSNLSSTPTFNSANVSWNAGTGAVNYRIEYRKSTVSTWTLAFANNASTSVNITNLDPSTDYIWRVRSNCSGATSGFPQATFTTQAVTTCNPPINPNTVSTTASSGTVSWVAATNEASSWQVEYKLQSATTWSIYASNIPIGTTQITITSLQADSNYDWRVRGNCGNIPTDYAVGTFSTITVVTAPTCLPNNWNFMEIEAKWQSDAATYNAIVNAFPDNGTWEGYSLNVRWSGIPRRYVDVYYDNGGSELSNGLHSVRHRTRSRCNVGCSNNLSSLQNGTWTKQWEKVQYKSNPSRYDAIWFREEQGDCELDTECSCSNENTIMAGACQHEATDRLLEDHPLFDFTTNAPISTVTQYRYRVELSKNGVVQYELSLDRVDEGNGIIIYENELEIVVPQGSRTVAQLDELFRLTSVLEANGNYSLTPSTVSKGGTPVPLQSLGDADGDGICDAADNCPNVSNANQANNDNDYHGNACDNCDDDINNDQLDTNNNGIGDVCEPPVVCDPLNVVFGQCQSFEVDLGSFNQVTTDDLNWTIKSGGTSSSNTGPSSAFDGSNYIYVESSTNGVGFPNKVAIIQSDCFTLSGMTAPTLSYYMHLYGSTMGSVAVNVINANTGVSTIVGGEAGDEGNAWYPYTSDLTPFIGQDIIIEFVATTGSSYRSDMALDNICIVDNATVCNPPTALNEINITADAAVVRWTASANATSYRVEYKKTTDTNWTLAAAGTSGTQVGLSSLMSNTSYNWRVRSTCGGDISSWTSKTFTTLQNTQCTSVSTVFAQCESFEAGLGGFTQGTNDDTDWTRKSGGTSSSNTGPASANDGTFYMYVEASSPNYPSKVARLLSECITLDDPNKNYLSFDYHMFGSSMGSLRINVITSSNNQSTQAFIVSGDQGNAWKDALIDLSAYSNQEIQIEFMGTTGSSFRSDIAIDKICFTNAAPACNPPTNLTVSNVTQNSATVNWTRPSTVNFASIEYKKVSETNWTVHSSSTGATQALFTNLTSGTDYEWRVRSICATDMSAWILSTFTTIAAPSCTTASVAFAQCESFETDLGIFNQRTDDDTNWTRKTGSTSSSNTGPAGAAVGTYYMYIEASSPNYPSKLAKLRTDCITFNDPNNTSLNFKYHMLGAAMGTLNVNIIVGNQSTQVFSISGNQGNVWNDAAIDLSSFLNQDIFIEFEGTTGSSFTSDISIDEVCLSGNSCNPNTNTINLPSYVSSEFFVNTPSPQVAGITGHDNGNVFAINDNATRLMQFNTSGSLVSQSILSGFADTEGIAYMGNNEFAIAEETRSRVVFVSFSANSMPGTLSYPSSANYITVNVGGMEGIAYDRNTGTLYVTKQNSKEIYEYSLGNQRSGTITPTAIDVSAITSTTIQGLDFLSSGNLLVLGSNAVPTSPNKTLFEIDVCGNLVSSKNINSLPNTSDGTAVSAGKMDGIAEGTDGCLYGVIDLAVGKLYKLCRQGASGITDCSRNSGIEITCSYNESFDSGFGLWLNASGDDLNWLRRTNSTSSSNTGPTAPANGSHYAYIESSTNNVGYPNKVAYLESPCFQIPPTGNAGFFISFNYHMYGSTMGTLEVEMTTDDVNWTSIWSRSGDQGNQWRSQFLDITQFNGQTIRTRFKAVTAGSFRSDFAIDNIQTGCILVAREVQTREEPSIEMETSLEVFPNPVRDQLHIVFNSNSVEDVNVQIFDQIGQLMKTDLIQKQGESVTLQYNVNDLESGIYHIRFKQDNQITSQRFVLIK